MKLKLFLICMATCLATPSILMGMEILKKEISPNTVGRKNTLSHLSNHLPRKFLGLRNSTVSLTPYSLSNYFTNELPLVVSVSCSQFRKDFENAVWNKLPPDQTYDAYESFVLSDMNNGTGCTVQVGMNIWPESAEGIAPVEQFLKKYKSVKIDGLDFHFFAATEVNAPQSLLLYNRNGTTFISKPWLHFSDYSQAFTTLAQLNDVIKNGTKDEAIALITKLYGSETASGLVAAALPGAVIQLTINPVYLVNDDEHPDNYGNVFEASQTSYGYIEQPTCGALCNPK